MAKFWIKRPQPDRFVTSDGTRHRVEVVKENARSYWLRPEGWEKVIRVHKLSKKLRPVKTLKRRVGQ